MTGTESMPPAARMRPFENRRESWLLLLAVFAVSRMLYFAAGVRFDSSPLGKFFQIFDPELLRTRLAETLFYSHTQPPGFNLLIGLVLKAFPANYDAALHGVYLLCGAVIAICVFELMLILGVRRWIALAVTSLFVVSPGMVLFENLLIYEIPLLALLCAAALCFYHAVRRPSGAVLGLFFTLLLALVSIRSLFHLGYLVLAAAVLAVLLPLKRRTVMAAAAVPFALAFGIYFKNWMLHGSFNSSTWLGFNIYTITTHQLNDEEKDRLIAAGNLSPVERIETLSHLTAYKDFVSMPPPRGVPVLDQTADSTGRPNFNHPAYFQLQSLYLQDGKWLLRNYPKAYARSVVKAWFSYFLPASDFPFFTKNRPLIRTWDRWFNLAVFGQFREASDRKELRRMEAAGSSPASIALFTGLFLLFGLPALVLFGAWALWKRAVSGPAVALLGFLLFHIVMITVLVNFLSSFENNRYRLPIDGFFVVLAAMAAERVWAGISVRTKPEPLRARAHAGGV